MINLGRKQLNQRIPNAARFPIVIEQRKPQTNQTNQYRLSAIITHIEGTGNSNGHYVCDVPNIIAQKKHNGMCYRWSDSNLPSQKWLKSVSETETNYFEHDDAAILIYWRSLEGDEFVPANQYFAISSLDQ